MPRLMLLPYPLLAVAMGLGYLLGDERRTAGQSFRAAKSVAPMDTWGVMFLLGALALTLALLTAHRHALGAALFVGGAIYSWWSLCFLLSALNDPGASVAAPAVHGFISAMHYLAGWAVWAGHR